MKKSVKIILFIVLSLVILSVFTILLFNVLTINTKLDENKIINLDCKINYCDANGNLLTEQSNGVKITKINELPSHVKNAFIAVEDKRFYKHHGVDYKGLGRAFINNLKSFSFKEGASTITQQLIKNTHLSSDKTLTRKLKEIKLAKKLEKKYSKNEILEKYLNTIYFGDGCYGITNASIHYFNKLPQDLTINESAILASIIKAPSTYSPTKNEDKNSARKNLILTKMHQEGFITETELKENIMQPVKLNIDESFKYDYFYLVKNKIDNLLDKNPYFSGNINIYTSFDKQVQDIIDKAFYLDKNNCNKTIIILDKNNSVLGYSSTIGDVNRQIGSTIKPISVYAPAVENNLIYSCSKILDEKININGYSPSNYKNKYYGYVSVKESLAKSLNSCAVKLLNLLGTEKSIEYLKQLNFNVTSKDANLSLALGATENGQKLTTLASSYGVFRNGNNKSINYNLKLVDDKKQTIYQEKKDEIKVFSVETAQLIKDMLIETVKNGTAKKLNNLNFTVCAKTGTVGNENGNTDAYTISFNEDYTIAVWYGNKNNELLNNDILGGTVPAEISRFIWERLYEKKSFKKNINLNNLQELYIDKILYEKNNEVLLSDDNAPMLYKQKEKFTKNAPNKKSNYFTEPTPSTPNFSVISNTFCLSLYQTELYCYEIYREINGKTKCVYVTKNNEKQFTEKLLPNTIYNYTIVPFYKNSKGEIFKGKEIVLKKIKSSLTKISDDWWQEDLD